MNSAMRFTLLFGLAMVAMPNILFYKFTGTADGSLNGVAFGGPTGFAITMQGESTNVVQNGSLFTLVPTAVTISLGALGSYSTAVPLTIFVNQASQVAGFSRTTGLDLFDTAADSSLATYNLRTPFGPISGSTASVQFWGGSFGAFSTSGGTMVFADTTMTGTFRVQSANIAVEVTPDPNVPEPSTAAMALGGLAIYGWRRMRR